jgi:hypothetical protein
MRNRTANRPYKNEERMQKKNKKSSKKPKTMKLKDLKKIAGGKAASCLTENNNKLGIASTQDERTAGHLISS